MKQTYKITLFFLSILSVMIAGSACNSQKTTQELLKEEKVAIQRFIDKNKFIILSEYPENGVFKDKEFYKTAEGLYIHVIDSGNGKRARYLKDEIQVRFEGMYHFKSDPDSALYKYDSPSSAPYSFIYGNSASYGTYGCNGWAIPLQYVGEEAVVSLIVPSKLGYSDDYSYIRPVYYAKLKYTRFY